MLRDVKPPVDWPFNFFLLGIGILGIVVLALLIFIYFFRRSWKSKADRVTPEQKPSWIIAYEQLEILRSENLVLRDQSHEYYTRLSSIIRQYFEGRFNIKAPEMTTEEFLLFLKNSQTLVHDQKETLKGFLIACDMVKFARHTPAEKDAENSFNLAKRLVDETKGKHSL